jgi:hypothetical protein
VDELNDIAKAILQLLEEVRGTTGDPLRVHVTNQPSTYNTLPGMINTTAQIGG